MRIERTHDMRLVRAIMTHPRIWPHVSDDGCSLDTFEPVAHDALYYLAVIDGDDIVKGCFFLHPHNAITYEVHTCLLPELWGRSAEAALACQAWIWANTRCRKIITQVPQGNRLAEKLALAVGFEREGINRASFLKAGHALDQCVLGLIKPAIGDPLCQ